MTFSSTLSSHSPPALPLTLPAYYPRASTTDPLLYSCNLTVDLTQNPFRHLTDQPILDPDTPHSFINGSSQKSPPLRQDMSSSRGTFITITGPRQWKLHLCHLTPPPNRQCGSHAFWETNSLRRTMQIVECSLLHQRAQGRVSS